MLIRLVRTAAEDEREPLEFTKPYVTIGRHPNSDVRFGPDRDLEVSSRHAAVLLRDGIFRLRDLGSTNGTFVNGERLRGDHVLAEHDVIRLGAAGPELRVAAIRPPGAEEAGGPDVPPAPDASQPPVLAPRPPRPTRPATVPVGELVAMQQRTLRMRRLLLAAGIVAALLVLALLWRLLAG